jgi:hypothetical protein
MVILKHKLSLKNSSLLRLVSLLYPLDKYTQTGLALIMAEQTAKDTKNAAQTTEEPKTPSPATHDK